MTKPRRFLAVAFAGLALAAPLAPDELPDANDRNTRVTWRARSATQPVAYGSEIATSPSDATDIVTYVGPDCATGEIRVRRAAGWACTTLPSGGGPPVQTHARRAAISADTTLDLSEATAGTSSMSATVTLPTWGSGTLRYRFIGVDENTADITDITQAGLSVFSGFTAYVDNQGDAIIVDGSKWWRDRNAVDGLIGSGGTLGIAQ